MSVLGLTGEESNFHVLRKVTNILASHRVIPFRDTELDEIIAELHSFLEPKIKQEDTLRRLTQLARGGDKDAAKAVVETVIAQKDGP